MNRDELALETENLDLLDALAAAKAARAAYAAQEEIDEQLYYAPDSRGAAGTLY